jgi:hypothetical protein
MPKFIYHGSNDGTLKIIHAIHAHGWHVTFQDDTPHVTRIVELMHSTRPPSAPPYTARNIHEVRVTPSTCPYRFVVLCLPFSLMYCQNKLLQASPFPPQIFFPCHSTTCSLTLNILLCAPCYALAQLVAAAGHRHSSVLNLHSGVHSNVVCLESAYHQLTR